MITFSDKIWNEYPIPQGISIWSKTDDADPVEDLDKLLEIATDELKSDILIEEHCQTTGMQTRLPDDAVSVTSCKLMQGFQGNRYVKFTFDHYTHCVYLRYFPAIISYRRFLKREDLETLVGDQLKFAKLYILWKMSQKELQVLKAIKLDSDNGEINLDVLAEFSESCKGQFDKLKEEILIYAGLN